jgi:hypothetical protein
MDTKVSAVQLVGDRYRAHSAFAAFFLHITCDIASRAEEQFPAPSAEAGARAAVLHTNVFIRLAVFYEH